MKKSFLEKDGKEKVLLFILVFFLFSVACEVLGLLYLTELKTSIIVKNLGLFTVLYGVAITLLFLVSIYFPIKGKESSTKFFLSFYILFLLFISILYVLEKSGFMLLFKDTERLQEYLAGAGVWMPVAYTLLQFLQVVILPIPSIVSTMAGVALFGAFGATVYSLIGILLGSYFAFFLGRKLGYRAVSWMVGRESLDKWQKKLKGKDNFILTLMFFLPLFPDDILCIVAGLSTMSTTYFICIITLSRIVGIVGTCYSVDFIPLNTWWGILLWVAFFTIMIILFFIVYKNMEKIQEKLRGFQRKNKPKRTPKE